MDGGSESGFFRNDNSLQIPLICNKIRLPPKLKRKTNPNLSANDKGGLNMDRGATQSRQVAIENPVINSPFGEPQRHFKFSDEGITDQVIASRRISSYFIPIPQPRKKNPKQLTFETEWTADRLEENKFINRVRERVAIWRKGGYQGITNTTRRLLEYWNNPQREHKLFFCQVEALETAIYITEVAGKYGDAWIENSLREASQAANPLLYRIAFKMATGSGKTLVIAMLIAWQLLNKLANPQDARFSDAFLICTPGITIRDRLRVLMPSDPSELLPPTRPGAGRPVPGAGQGPHGDHQFPGVPAARAHFSR